MRFASRAAHVLQNHLHNSTNAKPSYTIAPGLLCRHTFGHISESISIHTTGSLCYYAKMDLSEDFNFREKRLEFLTARR